MFTIEANSPLPCKGSSPHPTMSDINISLEGIYNLLLNINSHKACGPVYIYGRVLKETADIMSPFLKVLLKNDSRVIPVDWHSANKCHFLSRATNNNPQIIGLFH